MNYVEWRSRDQEGRAQLFRNAVRVQVEALKHAEVRISEWATQRLAEALVETVNRQGYTPVHPLRPVWHEHPFDYGAVQGFSGEILAVFTATKDQFIRWLEYELEDRDRRLRALEAWWGYRAWRVWCRTRAHVAGRLRRVWRPVRPPCEED